MSKQKSKPRVAAKKKRVVKSRAVAAKPAPAPAVALPESETVLVLRTCTKDYAAHGGFVYPALGPVSCPDFKPTKACGNGLHGLLNGLGNPDLLDWSADGRGQVLEVIKSEIIDLDGKVKFPRGIVLFTSEPGDALSIVRKVDRYAKGKGRHKLAATCERHGIALPEAHNAGADARACGELLFKIGRALFPKNYTLGQALGWCRRAEAEEWFRFNEWLSRQPPLESVAS